MVKCHLYYLECLKGLRLKKWSIPVNNWLTYSFGSPKNEALLNTLRMNFHKNHEHEDSIKYGKNDMERTTSLSRGCKPFRIGSLLSTHQGIFPGLCQVQVIFWGVKNVLNRRWILWTYSFNRSSFFEHTPSTIYLTVTLIVIQVSHHGFAQWRANGLCHTQKCVWIKSLRTFLGR